MVGERGLARAGRRAATDQRDRRRGVMRRAAHALAPARLHERAGQAEHGGRLERVFLRHRRQQASEALREHRLAGPGRTDHQQAGLTGRGDLERALGDRLPLDVAQVGQIRRGDVVQGSARGGSGARRRGIAGQQRRARRRAGAPRRGSPGPRPAPPRRRWRCGSTSARAARLRGRAALQRQAHRQRAAHRPQLAAERELARELECRQPSGIDLPARREDAERNWQVEAAGFFRQVGGREVDGDALVRGKLKPAVLDCGAHPLARFLDFGIGQADQREARQAVGQMHFDRDLGRRERVECAAVDDGEGHFLLGPRSRMRKGGWRCAAIVHAAGSAAASVSHFE